MISEQSGPVNIDSKDGKFRSSNRYLRYSGNSSVARRQQPRDCCISNPYSRNTDGLGKPAVSGGAMSMQCSPLGRIASTFDTLKPRRNDWQTLKKEVEKIVFPTLYSHELFYKLQNGKLLTQAHAFIIKKGSLAINQAGDPITL